MICACFTIERVWVAPVTIVALLSLKVSRPLCALGIHDRQPGNGPLLGMMFDVRIIIKT